MCGGFLDGVVFWVTFGHIHYRGTPGHSYGRKSDICLGVEKNDKGWRGECRLEKYVRSSLSNSLITCCLHFCERLFNYLSTVSTFPSTSFSLGRNIAPFPLEIIIKMIMEMMVLLG